MEEIPFTAVELQLMADKKAKIIRNTRRKLGKTIFFGVLYGMSNPRLRKIAEDYINGVK